MRSRALLAALTCGISACGAAAGASDAAAPASRDAASDHLVSSDLPPRRDPSTISDAALRDPEAPEVSVEGAKACRQAAEVRRGCTADSDCVAVVRVTSCCGSSVWMGIRASAITSFDTLEAACERSYSDCTCAAAPTTTDDGSVVDAGDEQAVMASCRGGTCTTFATACGHPCPARTSCKPCVARGDATCPPAQAVCR